VSVGGHSKCLTYEEASLVLDCLVAVYYTDDHHEEGEEDRQDEA